MNYIAVSQLTGTSAAVKNTLIAEIFSQIAADYKKSSTPYRRALLRSKDADRLLGFSLDECLEAVDTELANSTEYALADKANAALQRYVRAAIWRLANKAESKCIFEMFKTSPNEALKHIRCQLSDFYRRTANYVLDFYGYDLSIEEFASEIWLHLSANGTWRTFDTYRGDSSVYSWMRTVCRHCIIDYVESCGYSPCFSKYSEEDNDEDNVSDFNDVMMYRCKKQKTFVHYDAEEVRQLADNRPLFDTDFNTNDFIIARISEMDWEDWMSRFMVDSIIEGLSATMLTEKYGAEVARLHGKSTPYTRTWTDNINSRLKRRLYKYANEYLNRGPRFAA